MIYPKLNTIRQLSLAAAFLLFGNSKTIAQQRINGFSRVDWWLTRADKSALLAKQDSMSFNSAATRDSLPTIIVDPEKKYQSIDGFGFALTGGSAMHIINLSPAARSRLLTELFGTGINDFGISYLRVSIGSSDLNDHVFSYDDLPAGQTDTRLAKFSLAEDKKDVIPVLKEILSINPKLKILGSPWSAPIWMKTNDNIQGGMLKEKYYPVYARYFVKYITGMKQQGITIDAITVQNEPFNNGNTPSMQLFAKQELNFIKNYLHPLFKSSGIKTKIILYDHNCDAPEYPISILTDPEARKDVDGSGFHLYAGPIAAMTKVHNAFPDKNLYFTEYMIVNFGAEFNNIANKVSTVIIGATRNWSRNVILWNLAADSNFEPHTGNGGCSMCQGAVTIDGDKVTRNIACYAIAHFSKFVPPNSIRIESTFHDSLANVAFLTPAGKTVLIVANTGHSPEKFNILYKGKTIQPTLSSGSVATFLW